MRRKGKDGGAFKRVRTLHLSAETRRLLERQLEAFRAKFGREPGPDDPIFFDPAADHPRPLELGEEFDKAVVEAARAAGLSEPVIAFVQQNVGRNALFECERCKTQLIGWALAQSVCPECGHHPMRQRMIIAK